MKKLLFLLLPVLLGSASMDQPTLDLGTMDEGIYAIIQTNKGEIVIQLFYEQAPLTTTNFIGLAEGTIENDFRGEGEPFYDGLTFHRVVPDFVIQGGDPLGTGEGDPGYEFPDEFIQELRHGQAGMVSMANSGPNTNGSQFFIMLNDQHDRLNFKHSVFGQVIAGIDTVQSIEQGDQMETITIFRKGAEAEAFTTEQEDWERRLAEFSIIPPPPDLPHYFLDYAGLEFPVWYPTWLVQKLHNYEIIRGTRIYVRTFERFVPVDGEPTPEAFNRRLTKMLGWTDTPAGPNHILISYFESGESWVITALGEIHNRLFANHTTDGLVDMAYQRLEEPNPRRMIDSLTTVIIEILDQDPLPSSNE